MKISWKSKYQYIDIDTGEILTRTERNENYQIIGKSKKIEIYEKEGTITHTYECRRLKYQQQSIWYEER